MNFIKRVFDGKMDNHVHLQFQRFSKGEFRNRALIEAKNSGGKYTIKTSAEFANEFVRDVSKKLGADKTKITGVIISTSNLDGNLNFKDKKQFQGVKKYAIDGDMSGKDIENLLEGFPKNFFALSFSAGDTSLKIKPKAPQSGKPGKGDEAPKVDFCVLKTTDAELAKSFIFEKPDFKEARVNHTFVINSLEVPEKLKSSDDFARIREECKRVGKIIRKAIIDGKEFKSEKNFAV